MELVGRRPKERWKDSFSPGPAKVLKLNVEIVHLDVSSIAHVSGIIQVSRHGMPGPTARRTSGGSAVRVDVRVWSGVLAVAILAEA
jgi:hypothetical protein